MQALYKFYQRIVLLILLALCLYTDSKAQQNIPSSIDTSHFSITPTNHHQVTNGMAIGWTAHPWTEGSDTIFVKVNGLNLEVGPLGIVGGLWGTMYGLAGTKDDDGHRISFFSRYGYDSLLKDYPRYGTHINGLSLSIGGVNESYNRGLIINGLSGFCYTVEGVQVSGMVNSMAELKGISVAAIANIATRARGIQIGLINKCQSGNVLQIGLFNRIGKRVLPFINFSMKKMQQSSGS
jgi:hypothetical protein